MFRERLDKKFIRYAKTDLRTIALPEAEFSGVIIKAAEYCVKKQIANIVLIGDEQKIKNTFLNSNFEGITFISPKDYDKKDEMAKALYEIRKPKGLSLKEAKELILNPIYFATMLLEQGVVDGVVGGAATTTADMLRPALQIIKTDEGIKTVSSSFIMIGKRRLKIGDKGVFLLGDCAINANPNSEELADIAVATARTAQKLAKLDVRMAMLSYSTHGSAQGEMVKKVADATKLVKEKAPELLVEGELQADSALLPKVARVKVKNSLWKGKANVLIFPDLNSGNIGYKLMRLAGKLKAIGPIVQGLSKPVNDLSRGASLKEVILTIAITSLQASNLSEEERLLRKKQEKLEKKLAKKEQKQQKMLEEENLLEKAEASANELVKEEVSEPKKEKENNELNTNDKEHNAETETKGQES